ncbi:helix-turn-helix domain-containing protein [Chitinophaga sp. CF418]|uniref:helix-turn-helix domain-containing protein n=1 Tax=Chitinophaga sp. CF418 TaxID=1855287 RepID=UPI00091E1363|nr:helix-turn-helix domain-containing protein [Chitinophaga sp. CF418]SHM45986.1 AraC family transcriptional regulator [Chitinophaga sp. CF418]
MNNPVVLSKGCYVGSKVKEHNIGYITTSETIFPENLTSDWHCHENPHFSHILSGGSQEIREKKAEQQMAGTGLYYYPGVIHQNVHYRPGTRIFNLEIEESFFNTYNLAIPPESLMYEGNAVINAGGLLRLLREHYYNDSCSSISLEQLCINLIDSNPTIKKHYPEWTRQIITVLNDLWDEPPSLAELAAQINIHPVTLSKYFSRYFSCTLGEYLRRIKIERALVLVRSKKYSLTEIAYMCGFTDQAHFTRTFRQVTAMLPKEYKKI